MSIKFEVEETFSEGLDKLQARVSKEMEYILNELAYSATGYEDDDSAPIPERMSTTYNPFLFLSGQLEENRIVDITENKGEITFKYSGRDLEEFLGDHAKVWWEFSEELDPGLPEEERTLARDYAFYQETGVDKIARPRGAKHKYAIQRGLWAASQQQIHYTLESQVKRILNML